MSFFKFAAEYEMFPRDATVLCAVSGGADSMYLLANLLERSADLGCTVAVAHFDHQIRENSARDAAFVREWCAQHGVSCVVGCGNVAAEAVRRGTGIEETARMLRYAFLKKTAEELGASVIATAHTADDNAETMLMNLVRGSGLEGLCGIPPRRGNLVRPMLLITRKEIEAWLTEKGIPHVEDESNADERYTRNFLRHQVMPLLKQINPKAVDHMTNAAARLRQDHEELNGQAARLLEQAYRVGEEWVLPLNALTSLPDAVVLRALRKLFVQCGGENVSAAHLTAVMKLIRGKNPSAILRLPKTRVRRLYTEVRFSPCIEEEELPQDQPVKPGSVVCWGNWTVTCERAVRPPGVQATPMDFWLAEERIREPLLLSSRRTGDTLQPPTRPNKTVKKWFIDEKIPRTERERIPVLRSGDAVAAVGGLGAEECKLAETGQPALHITLKKQEGAEKLCILT